MKVLLVIFAFLGTGMLISGCVKKTEKKESAVVGTPTPTPKPKSTPTVTETVETTQGTFDMPSTTPVAPVTPVEQSYSEGIRSDREGFVYSPYARDQGLVDVRGFPPGTEVRDPYSGKTFIVP